ncbi:glutaminyl-peptide cyclotransferase isoform X2 [Drosophila mojavensis]|nr:glutaminyl-peptide cyclotransferase isoform X2 [Drosophila mojavensis]
MFRVARIVSRVSIVLLILSLLILLYLWQRSFTIRHDELYFNHTLANILKPRWMDSPGHEEVASFLFDQLGSLGFIAFRDQFFDQRTFTNILGIMNIDAPSFLLLTCHYDSKFLKNSPDYVGATDGAVSCAILLHMARVLHEYLREQFSRKEDIGLMLVFFDGHESMLDVKEDINSLNGSRHFAAIETMPLRSIELIISLNLIGAPDHIFLSHFSNTYILHERLADIEAELRKAGQLTECHKLFHKVKDHDSDIEDDHYPFISVIALHIVPHTYPEYWHTEKDNLANLYWPAIRNMNLIFPQFVYEYLENRIEFLSRIDKYG